MAAETASFPHSSNVASASYDAETQMLTVSFKSGGSYEYDGVDAATWHGLIAAPSPGKYLWANIKDVFTSRRV